MDLRMMGTVKMRKRREMMEQTNKITYGYARRGKMPAEVEPWKLFAMTYSIWRKTNHGPFAGVSPKKPVVGQNTYVTNNIPAWLVNSTIHTSNNPNTLDNALLGISAAAPQIYPNKYTTTKTLKNNPWSPNNSVTTICAAKLSGFAEYIGIPTPQVTIIDSIVHPNGTPHTSYDIGNIF